MPSNRSSLSRGYTIALISAAILSTTAIFIRYLTQTTHIPALVLAMWRDGIVAVSVLIALALLRARLIRVSRQHLPYLIAYGVLLAIFNSLWTLAVAINGAAVATVLVYCSAAFTALLGWWFLHESLGWVKLAAIGLSLGGCVLVSGALDSSAWQANLIGILAGVLSGLCYAIYSLMGRSASQRGLNSWTTLLYTFSVAALFLVLINLVPVAHLVRAGFLPGAAVTPSDFLWLDGSLSGWGILIALAAGPTLLGFGLYNMSLSYLPASVANLIVTLEPVFTAATAYVLLGERLTVLQIAGSLLILGGVVFLRLSEGRAAPQGGSQPPARDAYPLAVGDQESP